jgi:hypothetical protein
MGFILNHTLYNYFYQVIERIDHFNKEILSNTNKKNILALKIIVAYIFCIFNSNRRRNSEGMNFLGTLNYLYN